jgi:hypothetical protein
VLDKDDNEIPLKDYSDDDDGPDERRFSEEELGKSVLENGDTVMYDDELSSIEAIVEEPEDIGFEEEEIFVYDENDDE